MARVVLVALVCAVGAEDYGVGMPQYGGGGGDYAAAPPPAGAGAALEDYRGHSPDAPAPLDYKYEEEPQDLEKLIKHNEVDTWSKPRKRFSRNRKELEPPPDDDVDLNAVAKLQPERLQPRRRSRLANKRLRTEESSARRRRGRYGRSRDDDALRSEYLDKDDYRNDKENIDEDIDTFTRIETTERTIRRKPRDRSYVKPPKRVENESDEDLEPNRMLKEERVNIDYEEDGRRRVSPGGDRRRPVLPDDEEPDEFIDNLAGRYKPKSYREYNEYYDRRAVQNMKDKMPTLLRRTTTMRISASAPPPTSVSTASASTSDLLALLWTARRAGHHRAPEPTAPAPAPSSAPDTDPTEAATDITVPTVPSQISSESTPALSIAEKSRLSILKKAQKKESVKGDPTKKPPVLLQVTSNLPTVVMVEPPTSGDPWMRARRVSGDSLHKLDKVKRLMRRKLVADAKSIQDLTDNWDELVCDYIDVSLLDSASNKQLATVLLCAHFVIPLLMQ